MRELICRQTDEREEVTDEDFEEKGGEGTKISHEESKCGIGATGAETSLCLTAENGVARPDEKWDHLSDDRNREHRKLGCEMGGDWTIINKSFLKRNATMGVMCMTMHIDTIQSFLK